MWNNQPLDLIEENRRPVRKSPSKNYPAQISSRISGLGLGFNFDIIVVISVATATMVVLLPKPQ